jgi:hypothetical protein
MNAVDFIKQAMQILEDRAKDRDTPQGERSMKRAVAIFKARTDVELSEYQGWIFIQCLKHAREAQGAYSLDDTVDDIGYAALRGECRSEM